MAERSIPSSRPPVGFVAAAVGVTAALLFLHLFRLGDVPPGFFIDESAIGWNAWSLGQTGADEYGTRYPLFFRAFDNHHDPVMVYLLAPVLQVTGLDEAWVRAPSALFHVLASLAFGLLVHEYTRSRGIALAGVAVFGVLPWTFPMSRSIMAGYTPMLLGMNLGWWALVRGLRLSSRPLAVLGGLAWAFAMYSHNIGRPMSAVLLAGFALAYPHAVVDRRAFVGVFVAVLGVSVVPLAIAVLGSPALTERLAILAIWRDDASLVTVLGRFAERYAEYFSPGFLFVRGDANFRHHTGLGGALYWSLLPLVVTGLFDTLRSIKTRPESRVLLIALVVYPLAAALTWDHFHSTRSLNGAPVWCLLAAVGLGVLWRLPQPARTGLGILAAFALFEAGVYLKDYFGPYTLRSRFAHQALFTEALEVACDERGEDEMLYVSPSTMVPLVDEHFKPYMYAQLLFFCEVPPEVYQAGGLEAARIRLYDGETDGPGLLLRGRMRAHLRRTGMDMAPNSEPIPQGAERVREFHGWNAFELWRVP